MECSPGDRGGDGRERHSHLSGVGGEVGEGTEDAVCKGLAQGEKSRASHIQTPINKEGRASRGGILEGEEGPGKGGKGGGSCTTNRMDKNHR